MHMWPSTAFATHLMILPFPVKDLRRALAGQVRLWIDLSLLPLFCRAQQRAQHGSFDRIDRQAPHRRQDEALAAVTRPWGQPVASQR
jgi:hypothetical protein